MLSGRLIGAKPIQAKILVFQRKVRVVEWVALLQPGLPVLMKIFRLPSEPGLLFKTVLVASSFGFMVKELGIRGPDICVTSLECP